jgi:hypothetical protein
MSAKNGTLPKESPLPVNRVAGTPPLDTVGGCSRDRGTARTCGANRRRHVHQGQHLRPRQSIRPATSGAPIGAAQHRDAGAPQGACRAAFPARPCRRHDRGIAAAQLRCWQARQGAGPGPARPRRMDAAQCSVFHHGFRPFFWGGYRVSRRDARQPLKSPVLTPLR